MTQPFSVVQIRLLLALYQHKQLTKSGITNRYHYVTKSEREKILSELIAKEMVVAELRPTLHSRKTPTYYFLAEKGRAWVKGYLKTL